MSVSYLHANNVKVFPAVKSLRAYDVDSDFIRSFGVNTFPFLSVYLLLHYSPHFIYKAKES